MASQRRAASDLLLRQERFVEEYLVDFNATAAHQRAGYDRADAVGHYDGGNRMLGMPAVRERINERMAEICAKLEITQERVLVEYARIAYADIGAVVKVEDGRVVVTPSDQWSEQSQAAVAEIRETVTKDGGSIAIKMHSKLDALAMLAKYTRLVPEKSDVNINADKVLLVMDL